MGVYDYYGRREHDEDSVQLKVGPCALHLYKVGDKADIPDGVYVGYEGIVTVYDGKVVAINTNIFNKWGGLITIDLDLDNPVAQAIKKFKKVRPTASKLSNRRK